MKQAIFFVVIYLMLCACNRSDAACEAEKQTEEHNKQLVKDFYQKVFGDKNPELIDRFIADDYIQHSPDLADGKAALLTAAKIWLKDGKKEEVSPLRIAAENDLVFAHFKRVIGSKTFSIISILRIKDGKLAEHWDVTQEVPEKSGNPHPMF